MDFSAGFCSAYELDNAQKAKKTLIIDGGMYSITTADHVGRYGVI
jgi:hypothetical protein